MARLYEPDLMIFVALAFSIGMLFSRRVMAEQFVLGLLAFAAAGMVAASMAHLPLVDAAWAALALVGTASGGYAAGLLSKTVKRTVTGV